MTSGLEDSEDPYQQARAYNTSILFMLSVPYVVLGGLGLLLYSKYRKGLTQPAGETPSLSDPEALPT